MPPVHENGLCIDTSSCQTSGANAVGIPESVYVGSRGHASWYQALRSAAINFCSRNASETRTYATMEAALEQGMEDHVCAATTLCPASLEIHSDVGFMDSTNKEDRWGIISNGTRFVTMNSYMGELICSAGTVDPRCEPLRNAHVAPDDASVCAYQMEAVSAKWPVPTAVDTEFVAYPVEWFPGTHEAVRWMVAEDPVSEIPAKTGTNPPQGATVKNPIVHHICDAFPMDLRVEAIRADQEVSSTFRMRLACDPETHPTREWNIPIILDVYQEEAKKVVAVHGKGVGLYRRNGVDHASRLWMERTMRTPSLRVFKEHMDATTLCDAKPRQRCVLWPASCRGGLDGLDLPWPCLASPRVAPCVAHVMKRRKGLPLRARGSSDSSLKCFGVNQAKPFTARGRSSGRRGMRPSLLGVRPCSPPPPK
ncbi:hypothetical protein PsorP6_015219 [Peronosclerospora sorghi]|uniref:Uncharacterized protein n=1 Tax=Peronosclerospora sorghi TaxID=230839 RepID=A0ACC0VR84_9STRA|nr:hypothetical protein PsorP6_015219 [Peronosclerospora sorghi]